MYICMCVYIYIYIYIYNRKLGAFDITKALGLRQSAGAASRISFLFMFLVYGFFQLFWSLVLMHVLASFGPSRGSSGRGNPRNRQRKTIRQILCSQHCDKRAITEAQTNNCDKQ